MPPLPVAAGAGVFFSPLLCHGSCDSGKCFAPVFCTVFCKNASMLAVVFFAVRAGRAKSTDRLDCFGWYQLRKIFQPKACPFAVRVPKFLRLYCLRISRQLIHFARDGIFNAYSWAVCIQKFHKKSFARQSFFVPFPIQNVIFPQMSCSRIAEIGARRMCNQYIPSSVYCM